MHNKQALLQPMQLGAVGLKNRVIMAPMTRSRADNPDKTPTELHVEYYRQRASAGLIITEGSQVSERAVGYINTPGIYNEKQATAWKKVTEAVHEEGGKIFMQLWHVGRISHPDFHNGEKPWAPSAVNPNAKSFTPQGFKDTVTPHEMTTAEVKKTVQEFKTAAKFAVDAGFDGVEIHSSNGYLFHQFFNDSSNQRTDEYGGSVENKTRFLFEVLDAVSAFFPKDRIGVRLNPSLHGIFGMEADKETIPTFEYIVKKLNDYDLAYLHLSEPFNDVSEFDFLVKHIARHFRPLYHGNLMINTGFDSESGNDVINNEEADCVAFGKPFVSNPDLVERFEHKEKLADWDESTFYTTGEKGYTDYLKLPVNQD